MLFGAQLHEKCDLYARILLRYARLRHFTSDQGLLSIRNFYMYPCTSGIMVCAQQRTLPAGFDTGGGVFLSF
jgi:hypothetical protein